MTTAALDIAGEDICKKPAAFAATLRERGSIFFEESLGFWVVSSHEDAKQLFMHDDFHMSAKYAGNASTTLFAEKYPHCQRFRDNNPFNDDVSHPLIRKLLVRAFSPSALKRIERQIAEAIDNIVKPILTAPGIVDVATQLAEHIPYAVLSSIFGVDRLLENKQEFLEHCKTMARMIDPTVTSSERVLIERSAGFMQSELEALVVRARENPGEDLISDFLKAADDIGGLTDYDLAYTLIALITTGSTATTFTLTLIIHALLTQPEQRAWLMQHPENIDAAVEELIRFAHGAKFAYRFAMRDTEYKGFQFKRGQTVMISFAGISNDPTVFDHPERCDFTRNNKDALSFGHGVHYCVGAHVARTEIRFLIQSFMDYAPEAFVISDKVTWNLANFLNREISHLPVNTGH